MAQIGMLKLRRGLDPAAQEFRPGNLANPTPLPPVVFGPPLRHLYYSFGASFPPQVDAFRNSAITYSPNFPVYFNPAFVNNNPLEEIAVPQVQHLSSYPTRSLLLSAVPSDVSESVVRRDLEGFGDVRWVQTERIRDGIITVHFYDLRHAERAFQEMRDQHLMRQKQLRDQHSWSSKNNFDTPPRLARALIGGHVVWAEFIIPTTNAAVPDWNNQGTIVVFNLESDVSASTLKETFERFGPVKEFREVPLKKHRRFIEFFDVRDAAKAVKEMNGKEIHGMPVAVEFSRPGGHERKFFNPMIARHHRQPPLPRTSKLSSGRFNDPHRPFYSQAQFSPKKLHSVTGRSFNYAGKLVDKLQPLNCSGSTGNGIVRRDSIGTSRRINVEKIINRQAPPNSKQEASSLPRINIRLRRNKLLKKSDPCFLISENGMDKETSDCIDCRTTVMIKNIPNKYSLKLLLKTLDKHCMKCNEEMTNDGKDLPLSSYDFVYLPIDFSNKCNVGYGFVNMTSPQGAWRLFKAFHLQAWQVFNSRKICQVTYARLQGLEALKEHFRNSKFPREMEQYELPVVFSPPRDGIHLTEPLAVAGNMRVGGVNTSAADGDGGDEGRPSDAAATAADQSSEVVLCGEGDDGNEEDS
ncbi:protein terminal ear1-like [Cucurbita pepo subsp. pepo]|uniref:protein terminal ear1-like n=1 Tax=Cucurbita pepo subsp. pepo TaxID=3664 RepID=UPI000C9DA142|nr:protein terminal ear1-like [Cucurbita pepo subsp. pepo]